MGVMTELLESPKPFAPCARKPKIASPALTDHMLVRQTFIAFRYHVVLRTWQPQTNQEIVLCLQTLNAAPVISETPHVSRSINILLSTIPHRVPNFQKQSTQPTIPASLLLNSTVPKFPASWTPSRFITSPQVLISP